MQTLKLAFGKGLLGLVEKQLPIGLIIGSLLAVLQVVPCLGSAGRREKKKLILADKGQAKASIVLLPDAGKVAQFAASEIKAYLDKTTGASFDIADKMPASGAAILIGDSSETRKLGVSVEKFKRDGFIIRRIKNKIVIAGRDDKSRDIKKYIEKGKWTDCTTQSECATLFGVYDFLERVLGLRWYFPGNNGEFCPKKERIAVGKLNLKEEPEFIFRRAYMYSQRWKKDRLDRFHDYLEMGITDKDVTLWVFRNKVSTAYPAINHLYVKRFAERFSAEHPEWFALSGGKRLFTKGDRPSSIKLCYSQPGLIAEIVKDADAYFSGRPATERGLKVWNAGVANGNYFSLLPNDAFRACECAECQAKLSKKTNCSELVWGYVAEVAGEIEKKHPGKFLTCLSYTPYKKLPETVKLPKNVVPGVALLGPCNARGGEAEKWQIDNIKEWKDFSGSKVILWTYNAMEVLGYRNVISGIPRPELKTRGRFYKSVKDDILGAFYENEIEYGFQNHLDLYFFQKITWDPDLDVEALLREYCRNMYGPAAREIKTIIDRAEDLWINRITSPVYQERHQRYNVTLVSARELWEGIYSPSEMKNIRKLISRAENKVKGTEHEPRLSLFKRRFINPIEKKYTDYRKQRDSLRNGVRIKVPYFYSPVAIDGQAKDPDWRDYDKSRIIALVLASAKTKAVKERTSVRHGWDNEYLYFLFTCQESSIDKIKAEKRKSDDVKVCLDDEVEIFIDPSNQRKGCFQILVNAAESIADIKYTGDKTDISWNSNAKLKIWQWQNPENPKHAAWYLEIAIPFASLGGAPKAGDQWAVNFCRSRKAAKPHELSTWSPFITGEKFYQPEWFGQMYFEGVH